MADNDVKTLMLQIDASVELLRKELDKGEKKISDFERFVARKTAEADRSFGRMGIGLTGVGRAADGAQAAVRRMVVAAAGGLSAREFIRLADTVKQIDARLKLATQASGNFARAQADVRRIADETLSSLEATADLYATFQRNAVELGISQEQSARATETVSKAFHISGATAAEAAGGLRQFLQGIQSGALRGEELNSVLENAPRLAKLIADSLGVTIGALRDMGKEGKLTGDKLITALTDRKFTASIDAEFRELPVTFDEAMQQLRNALTVYIGAADDASGATSRLVDAIMFVTQNIDTAMNVVTLLTIALGTRYVVGAGAAAARSLMTSNAMLALQARMAGAATTAEALTFALRGLGTATIVTGVILALGAALYYLHDAAGAAQRRQEELDKALDEAETTLADYHAKLKEAGVSTEELGRISAVAAGKVDTLADSYNRASVEAHKLATNASLATIELLKTQAAIGNASRTRQVQAERELRDARGTRDVNIARFGNTFRDQDDRKIAALEQQIADEKRLQNKTDAAQEAIKLRPDLFTGDRKPPAPPSGKGDGAGNQKKGRSGPSAPEIAERHEQEMARFREEELRAQMDLADNAADRADFAYDLFVDEYKQRAAKIKADKQFDAAQKKEQVAALQKLYGVTESDADGTIVSTAAASPLGRLRHRDLRRDEEREAAADADAEHDAQAELLRIQYDLTDSNKERARLAEAMIDLDIAHQRAKLEAIAAEDSTAEAYEKRAAKMALDSLDRIEAGRRKQAANDHMSPGERYLAALSKEAANLGDAYETVAVNGLERLNDSLSKSVRNALGLHGVLGDIIGDLIEIGLRQHLIGPLAGAIFGDGSSGSGLLGSLFGSIFGGARAGGGPVEPGKAYLVGEKRPELFVPRVPGTIVPRVPTGGGAPQVSIPITINAPGATAETAAMIRREVALAARPIAEAARNATLATLSRPRLP